MCKQKVILGIAFIGCCLYPFIVYSQSPGFRFEHITSEQGLADVNINAIIQDARGFIWVGSEDGLTKYDGYSCVVYRHESNDPGSLSDNEVYALCTDKDGALWVGTKNGLNRFDAMNDRFQTFFHDANDDQSLAANEILALARDSSGNLWIGTYGGGADMLVQENSNSENGSSSYHFIHHRHSEKDSNSISSDQVLSLSFDSKGTGWIGTVNGLNILNTVNNKFERVYDLPRDKNAISNNVVNKIFAGNDGSVWICGKGMLDKIASDENIKQNNRFTKHFLPLIAGRTILKNWAVNDFLLDQQGNAWMATNDQGLIKFKYNDESGVFSFEQFLNNTQVPYSLVSSTVVCIYEDRSGVIWIGTAKGLSKYVPAKKRFNEVVFPGHVFPPPKNIIKTITSDKQNRLWLGYDSDSITIINGKQNNSFSLKLKPPLTSGGLDQINVLFQSRSGDIYIGTLLQGLFIIPASPQDIHDKNNWIHLNAEHYQGLPSNNIYSFAEDAAGLIWIGTYKGVCVYNPGNRKINAVYVSPKGRVMSDYIIRALCIDKENVVWCGTDNGLYLIKDGKEIRSFKNREADSMSISNNGITVIRIDKNKNIWVGTKAGLNCFNAAQNNFIRFAYKDGLSNDVVKSILQDSAGNLWIGTNHGLSKFSVTEKKFYAYRIEDGLCSDQFIWNATCSDSSGIFYFCTSNGLVSFKPGNIIPNKYVPPVVITDVKVMDMPLTTLGGPELINTYKREKKLVLKYDQNFFSFQFAALNYINSGANQYAYQLEGIDKKWNEVGTRRFAGYTNISPGDYTFKVKASNNDGVWNNEPAMLQVIILPPWWQTWWFYALCFITACAIMYMIYRIRLRQILKLYRLRSSIAKDLHDDVGSALSSIALLSSIAREGKTNARLQPAEIFSRIGDTSKRMIDLMDDIVWSVNPDNDRFSNMLVRMREYAVEMLEAKNINFSFNISKGINELKIPMQKRKDYFLIFKEAVNNLAKYSACNNACINIYHSNHSVITSVTDDGKGFDPQIIHSGNGLKNMYARAGALKGKVEIKTQQDKGTSVIFTLPVN